MPQSDVMQPAAARFTPSAPTPVTTSNVPTKPAEDDKIGPVGTAYTPIKLQPRKLVNPFAAMQANNQSETAGPKSSPSGGAKKLTWSERQALAKKQQEEDEVRAKAALGSQPTPPSAPAFRSIPPRPTQVSAPEPEPEDEYEAVRSFRSILNTHI